MTLSLAFSPCPNDCFIFDAIVNRRVDLEGLEFSVTLADVEALNCAAFAGDAAITKLSFHAYAYCAGRYVLLDAGSALGRNCGPLLISKRPISRDEVASGAVRIAIPGRYTTANLLMGLAFPAATSKTEVLFSDIEASVAEGRHDAGGDVGHGAERLEAEPLAQRGQAGLEGGAGRAGGQVDGERAGAPARQLAVRGQRQVRAGLVTPHRRGPPRPPTRSAASSPGTRGSSPCRPGPAAPGPPPGR